ncbi:uncharacterized protein LOC114273287 [Camellia sinensis]|uniref:uncharacterized protein LOC114273287 n=1 Tax=Camellia sinensis TaxID=4442 RepID=UPI001035AAC8|nr:uncharacterized protein LOC114273287 [Camellia sinensis]
MKENRGCVEDCLMKIMSWNVRGLRKPEKRSKIKALVRAKLVDVLMLHETKKLMILLSSPYGPWMIWDLWRNFILLSGILSQSFHCVICNIYAPTDALKRRKLWESLVKLKLSYPNPWCLGGDFNEIRVMSERKGCSRRERGMKDFNNFIESLELIDLNMHGRLFTWCNALDGERWSRIDRFLLDPVWLERYKFKQWGLPRVISDHCPVLLMEDGRDWGPKPFRFINAWTSHPQFKKEVEKVWEEVQIQGWASFRIMIKLKRLRAYLRRWNMEVFGNIDDLLKQAEDELHEWDLKAESRSLLESEVNRRREK